MDLTQVNFLLALGTVVLQILTVGFVALFFLHKKFPDLEGIADFLANRGLWIGFFLTLGASAMTLIYSDVLGVAACIMCWWQRVCLYPQIAMLSVGAWFKERTAALSSIILSVIGGGIAFYQHLLQMGVTSTGPCTAIPGTDCSQRFLFEFGYITFPLISFSLFAFLIVLMLFVWQKGKMIQ